MTLIKVFSSLIILLMCLISCQREPHCATCYDQYGASWRICEPTALELRNIIYDQPNGINCHEE